MVPKATTATSRLAQPCTSGVPKMIATNTSWEYWRSDACLNHIDPADNRDRVIGSDHRFYALAGIDHMGDNPMKAMMKLANPTNPLGYQLLVRAAFDNLVSWVVDGTEPPPNTVPNIADHSASTREDVLTTFARLPGVSHWVQQEAPEAVNAALQSWLAGRGLAPPHGE